MTKKAFYRSGEQLSVTGHGQLEGRQKIAALRPRGIMACPKSGCVRYEKGYAIVLNLADPEDANVARFVHEGKMGRYEEQILESGVIRFWFLPGQCSGHRRGWEEPVYIVGQRKTNHDEFHSRYIAGSEALVKATTRVKEMSQG